MNNDIALQRYITTEALRTDTEDYKNKPESHFCNQPSPRKEIFGAEQRLFLTPIWLLFLCVFYEKAVGVKEESSQRF